MIDFSVCKNCGLPIFFDWQGAHHVRPESYGPLGFLQFNPESEPCGKAEEEAEEPLNEQVEIEEEHTP